MRAISLLLVLAAAKAMMLAGHHLPLSAWSPLAYFWHDALVVLAFAAVEWAAGRRGRILWAAYAAMAAYAAVNVPVARVLSTPLTWPMLRAARGPLTDSMWHGATWSSMVPAVGVLGVAALAPLVVPRLPVRAILGALIACVALGPLAAARVDTLGLERNAWSALVTTAIPRVSARALDGDWRASRAGRQDGVDLLRFRGAAAGLNVVLVSLESTAAQYLGLYGASPDVMPNLSKLAGTAIVFDHAYAVYPESIKGLFSILCSRYPAFDVPTERYAGAPCASIAEVFSGAGYRTALFHSGRFMYLGMEAVVRERGFQTLEDAGDIGGRHESSFGVDERSTSRRILDWIDRLGPGERFFVTYLPIAGHHPYDTPEPGPFPDADDFDRYRNALHESDRSLGALVDGLAARGLARPTMWIVFGDHGEAFGQHEGNYGHTFQLYDENVRVPFVIAAPGIFPAQIRAARVVSLVDTAPTLVDLAGLGMPALYQGRSMLEPEPRAALFFADYSLGLLGLRDGPRKFIHEIDSGRSKLFDTARDPGETNDLSGREAADARAYANDLRRWSAAQKYSLSELRTQN